jgi:hypothetical protein
MKPGMIVRPRPSIGRGAPRLRSGQADRGDAAVAHDERARLEDGAVAHDDAGVRDDQVLGGGGSRHEETDEEDGGPTVHASEFSASLFVFKFGSRFDVRGSLCAPLSNTEPGTATAEPRTAELGQRTELEHELRTQNPEG